MLTPDQINSIHRLHLVDKWPLRKIARHLHIGRRTVAKYMQTPAPPPTHRDRASKLDPFKAAISELLERDPTAPATVIAEHLRTLGFDGGITIVKDYLQALRTEARNRRAYVRMEPGPGERFEVDGDTSTHSSIRTVRVNSTPSAWSNVTAANSIWSSRTARTSKRLSAVTSTPLT
jgi:hypothetical protein